MKGLNNLAWDEDRAADLKPTGYKCPSCNMVSWNADGFETEKFCPFCSDALPRYVTQVSPERMIMLDVTDQSKIEKQFNHSTRRNEVIAAKQEEVPSPFTLEFFMVQGSGFICMAYLKDDGKWRGAFDNRELPGAIRVLE
jgi:hypothetical protein